MTEQEIIAHVRDIVDGAAGRLEERVAGVSRRVDDGFKSTHKRIDGQAENIKDLTAQVSKTNGNVLRLRSDVDRIDGELEQIDRTVDEVRTRDVETRGEMVGLRESFLDAVRKFTHKRITDPPDTPAVEHVRTADVINENAAITPAFIRKYWAPLSGGVATLLYLGYLVGRFIEKLGGTT